MVIRGERAGDRRHRARPRTASSGSRTCSRSSSPRTCAGSSSRTTTSTTAATSTRSWTACPNAKLVCNWAMVERHTNCFNFPLDRCRWVMDGESLDVGDRTLHARAPAGLRLADDARPVRPDHRRVLGGRHVRDAAARSARWASPISTPEFWSDGLCAVRARRGEPVAHRCSTSASTAATSTRIQDLDITTIAACHSPVIEGEFIGKAFDRVRALPTLDPPPLPDQSVLDQIVAATSQPPA